MTSAELRAYEAGKHHAENAIAWRAWWIGVLCGAVLVAALGWRWM